MKALIPVAEVRHSPAMFKDERDVSVHTVKGKRSLLVDQSCLRGEMLECRIVERNGPQTLVELPGELWAGGRRVYVESVSVVEVLQ